MSRKNPHIVIACDKFKGSLTAAEVVAAIAHGVRRGVPGARVSDVVAADGGDGTLAAALAAGFEPHDVDCRGPLAESRTSAYALRGDTAVVELADACGIVHVPHGALAPLTATSAGLGDVIAAALDNDAVKHLIIGIGGSASTDGGAGMLTALGAKLLDAGGNPVSPGGAGLGEVATLDLSGLHPRVGEVTITLASDVNNPLTGPSGAAAVFAPQKGASPDDVTELDDALRHWAQIVRDAGLTDVEASPGAGGAGGVGFAAMAVLGASMQPGVQIVLNLTGFQDIAAGADLVITGEGSLDEQSLSGKTPCGVAEAARALSVPTIALCGRTTLTRERLQEAGIREAYALVDIEPDTAICFRDAQRLLSDLAENAVRAEALHLGW